MNTILKKDLSEVEEMSNNETFRLETTGSRDRNKSHYWRHKCKQTQTAIADTKVKYSFYSTALNTFTAQEWGYRYAVKVANVFLQQITHLSTSHTARQQRWMRLEINRRRGKSNSPHRTAPPGSSCQKNNDPMHSLDPTWPALYW